MNDAAPHVLNRCCVFTPTGGEAAHYDKIHLFAFDNGRENYDEGRTLAAGSEPVGPPAAAVAADSPPVRAATAVAACSCNRSLCRW